MYSFYKISRIEHMKTLRYDACSGIANYAGAISSCGSLEKFAIHIKQS